MVGNSNRMKGPTSGRFWRSKYTWYNSATVPSAAPTEAAPTTTAHAKTAMTPRLQRTWTARISSRPRTNAAATAAVHTGIITRDELETTGEQQDQHDHHNHAQ